MAIFHTTAGRKFSSARYNLPTLKDDNRVIVIGSGPAGATAAYQLRQQGIPVTMLEAGTAMPSGSLMRLAGRNIHRSRPDINNVPSPDFKATNNPKTEWHYSISHGGLSNYWTGAVPRFAPQDFTEGARLHERYRWPVEYHELAAYYDTVEQLIGVTGSAKMVANMSAPNVAHNRELPLDWQGVARHAAGFGQGLTVMPLADGPNWFYAEQGTAFNSFQNIVQWLRESASFKFVSGAHVIRLEWNDAKSCVDGVIYRDTKTGDLIKLEAAAVIVACGALNSARLLLNSTSNTFPHGLGNEEGVLGKYLHDHPREWWTFDVDKPISALTPSAYLTRRPYAESDPLLATSWTLGVSSVLDKARHLIGMRNKNVSVQIFGTMIPSEKHYVALDDSAESNLPKLKVHIDYDEATINNVHASRQHLLTIMANAGYDAIPNKIDEDQLYPGTSVHYGGTVRMHASPRYGMLDGHNRLHAVPNVLVCDASAFTTGVEKNPTLTMMALAARAAHKLAIDLKDQHFEAVEESRRFKAMPAFKARA